MHDARLRNGAGFALASVMLLLLIMTVIGVTVVDQSQLQIRSSAAQNRSQKADASSEGAVNMAAEVAEFERPVADDPDNNGVDMTSVVDDYVGLTSTQQASMDPTLSYNGRLAPGPGWGLNTPGYNQYSRLLYSARGIGKRGKTGDNATARIEQSIPLELIVRQ